MEISGKITEILPLREGEGKNGPWKRQDYILDVPGNFRTRVCVSVWGNRIDELALQMGEEVSLSIAIESREYNGRWYTDVKAFGVNRSGKGAAAPSGDFRENAPPPPEVFTESGDTDDLPF